MGFKSAARELPFLGVNGEEIEHDTFVDDEFMLHLVSVDGPGEFSLWQTGGTGDIDVLLAGSDGISVADQFSASAESHAHYNWGFSEAGIYRVTFQASGVLQGDATTVTSELATLTFIIGDATIAAPDEYMVTGGNMVKGNVFLNDLFVDGADPAISPGEAPGHGSIEWNADGSFTYIPNETFHGADSFSYMLSDGTTDTLGVVTITAAGAPSGEIFSEGHTDIGVNFEGDEWDLHIHDEENDAEYEPDEALLFVGNDGLTVRDGDAADPAYDFLGVDEGQTFYLLPQIEHPELLFLGIGGEELEAGIFTNDEVTLQLNAVSGPGQFSAWRTGSTADAPNLIFATADGVTHSDHYIVTAGSHEHMNFAFTEVGFYEVTFTAHGTTVDGQMLQSEPVTYSFRVGNNAPIAMEDSFSVDQRGINNIVFGNLLFNDSDPDLDPIVGIELGSGALQGDLTLHSNGAFEYRPHSTFSGLDTFSYVIRDVFGGTSVATVTINGSVSPTFSATLTEGHVDIGIATETDDTTGDTAWDLHVHDEEADEEYHPDEARLYVSMAAETVREGGAADPQFDFLGVAPGESFYLLPAIENPDVLYLGFGAEEIDSGTLQDGTLSLQLKQVSGPGHVSIWDTDFGGVDLLMATSDGIDHNDRIVLPEGSHSHFNFAFSTVGTYEVTLQAEGQAIDGQEIAGEEVTYYFQVGNHMDAIDMAGGMQQRSFVRDLDIVFADNDSLEDLLEPNRIRFTQYDLNGENGFDVLDPVRRPSIDIVDNVMRLDWGSQGIGGNRSTMLGDGYYRLSIDFDGDGDYDQDMYFHRLFGDVTGDGQVTSEDVVQIASEFGSTTGESDVNGDRRVNGIDRLLASRSLGRKLGGGLELDD